MGTSQSFGLKSTPNWSSAKRAITRIAKAEGDSNNNCSSFMCALSHAVGESVYSGGGARGGHYSLGYAGARTVKNLVSLVNNVQRGGLTFALGIDQLQPENRPITKEDFIDEIIKYVTGENDSNIDDGVSLCALRKVLLQILRECNGIDEIETVLRTADEDKLCSWIIMFEVEYILEFSGVVFYSHIFSKNVNPDAVLGEIRRWLHRELDNRFAEEMKQVDFNSPEGQLYIEKLTSEILKIWQ